MSKLGLCPEPCFDTLHGSVDGRARGADAATPEARRIWRSRCVAVPEAASGPPRTRDRRRKGPFGDAPRGPALVAARREPSPQILRQSVAEPRHDLIFARAREPQERSLTSRHVANPPRCESNGHFETPQVDGASPSEGTAKVPLARSFGSERLASRRTCRGMEPLNGTFRKERPAFAGLSFLVSRRAVYGPGGGGKQNVDAYGEKRLSMSCMFAAPSPFALPAIMFVSPLEFGL